MTTIEDVEGFVSIDLSYSMGLSLATVSQNQYRMGEPAMKKLLTILDNKKAESAYIKYEIQWRASVAKK